MATEQLQPPRVVPEPLGASGSRPRGSAFVPFVPWFVAVVAVVAVAAVQVHPSSTERMVVALIWVVAALVSLSSASRRQIHRWLPAGLLVATVVLVVALWNPWRLAAVNVTLRQPEALLVIAGLGVIQAARRRVTNDGPGADRARSLGVAAGLATLLLGVTVGVLTFGLAATGARDPHRSWGPVAGVRIDHHDLDDRGRSQLVVLRAGSGLGMREMRIDTGPSAAAVVEERDGFVEVCSTGDDIWTLLDPETLGTLRERGGPYCG